MSQIRQMMNSAAAPRIILKSQLEKPALGECKNKHMVLEMSTIGLL